jgi:hypothetical protein
MKNGRLFLVHCCYQVITSQKLPGGTGTQLNFNYLHNFWPTTASTTRLEKKTAIPHTLSFDFHW